MYNQFTEYKKLLQTFSFQEQIDEINDMTKKLTNKKHKANIKGNSYERIKEFNHFTWICIIIVSIIGKYMDARILFLSNLKCLSR